ncbi:MAG TPA: hypothetical protein PK511_08095 [Chitinophagales bacterium]|nr:hypothetical protein [Chitinophagales bacterium]HMU69293.1 hypothetical protein [Chitinophagales bacterium]HMX04470.1 hypothetical protein [Chitinophagales bacterium]HNA58375.1 hypothetical protein [Chitinophagales bacterium]HNE47042.1 hypothetical protein [Chitinophagales bacterium]
MRSIAIILMAAFSASPLMAQKDSGHNKLELHVGVVTSFTMPLGASDYDKSLFTTFIPAINYRGQVIYAHQLGLESSLHTGMGLGVSHYSFKLTMPSTGNSNRSFKGSVACLDAQLPLYTKFTIAKGKHNSNYAMTAGAELHAVNIFSQGFTATSEWEETIFEVSESDHIQLMATARLGIEGNHIGNNTFFGWCLLANYQVTPLGKMHMEATDLSGNSAAGDLYPGSISLTAGVHIPLVK